MPLHDFLCKLLVSEKTSVQVLGKFVEGGVGWNQQGLAVLLCTLSHLIGHAGKLKKLQEPGELHLALDQLEDGRRIGQEHLVYCVHHSSTNGLLLTDNISTLGSCDQALSITEQTVPPTELVDTQFLVPYLRLKKQVVGETCRWGEGASNMPEHELKQVGRLDSEHLSKGLGQLGECRQGGQEDRRVCQTFQLLNQLGGLQHCQQLGQLPLFQHICEFLGGVGDDDVADDVDDPVGRHDVGHDQLDALHGEVVLVVPLEQHEVPEQVVGSCTALDHTRTKDIWKNVAFEDGCSTSSS